MRYSRKLNRLYLVLAALAVWVVYACTTPANHTEAEDVYDYALRVEQQGWSELIGVNRLLALPVFSAVYRTADSWGCESRAFPLMIRMNRLLAVGSLLLFYRLMSHWMPRRTAVMTSLLLASSYGFWRYANEAETYMLALSCMLAAWCLVLRNRWLAGMLLSAFGVLVHLLNLIPLLVVIPFYYLLEGRWKRAVWHGLAAGGLVAITYASCTQLLEWSGLGARHHQNEAGFGPANLVRAGIAFGQCLVSGNFLFGWEGFRGWASNIFPSRMLGEEFFMGSRLAAWVPPVGGTTLLLAGLTVAVAVQWRGSLESHRLCWRVALAWLVLYALAVIRTEAGNPELWILALVPFFLLLAPLMNRKRSSWAVAALILHNFVGGILPVRSAETDYHAMKSQWILDHADTGDIVLTSYEPTMIFYLNYYSDAAVVNSAEWSVEQMNALLGNASGSVYALHNFFEPLVSMKVRRPDIYKKMKHSGLYYRRHFMQVNEDEFGGVFMLRREYFNE